MANAIEQVGVGHALFGLWGGVAATIWASYVAGPLYILCGILALVANALSKPKSAEEKILD